MGLNITSYTSAELLPEHPLSDACYDDDYHLHVHSKVDFPHSLGCLLPGRCYKVGGELEAAQMSYGGYNQWREILSRSVHEAAPREIWDSKRAYLGRSFYELINFSDCEGVIGPQVCAMLANDFVLYEPLVMSSMWTEEKLTGGHWMTEAYADLKAGFARAANTGLVRFG